MAINLMKRMESSVYSFNLTLQRICKLIDGTIQSIDAYDKSASTTLNLTDISNLDQLDADEKTASALLSSLKQLADEILELVPAETNQLKTLIDGIDDLVFLSHLCAANLEIPLERKQELLERVEVKARVLTLLDLMQTFKDQLIETP